ncbi:MAG: ProQ/FinO family protein [Gammaproteobacteria bacterium]|nr:ProQ/FinO family protein [Gammaproteobacteria bacterium]
MRNQPLHPHTAAINSKQKNLAKMARHNALTWLTEQFPKAFDNTNCIQPLKIGIINDILLHAEKAEQAGISKSKLREAVVIFTRRIDYLTCLKAREMRVDLDGQPTTQVSSEEAEQAALKIKRRIEKSTKNARQAVPKKQLTTKKISLEPHAPAPLSPFSAQQDSTARTNKPVTIKHKTARAFDPNAVARLKEKLGLARKEDANTGS